MPVFTKFPRTSSLISLSKISLQEEELQQAPPQEKEEREPLKTSRSLGSLRTLHRRGNTDEDDGTASTSAASTDDFSSLSLERHAPHHLENQHKEHNTRPQAMTVVLVNAQDEQRDDNATPEDEQQQQPHVGGDDQHEDSERSSLRRRLRRRRQQQKRRRNRADFLELVSRSDSVHPSRLLDDDDDDEEETDSDNDSEIFSF